MGGVNSSFHYYDVKASCSAECAEGRFFYLGGRIYEF